MATKASSRVAEALNVGLDCAGMGRSSSDAKLQLEIIHAVEAQREKAVLYSRAAAIRLLPKRIPGARSDRVRSTDHYQEWNITRTGLPSEAQACLPTVLSIFPRPHRSR